jgi:hypothetical protein
MALGGLIHSGRDQQERHCAQHCDLEPGGKLHAGLRLADDLKRDVRVPLHGGEDKHNRRLTPTAEASAPRRLSPPRGPAPKHGLQGRLTPATKVAHARDH